MKEIDWSMAPHGATHYSKGHPYPWMMEMDGVVYRYVLDAWVSITPQELGKQRIREAILREADSTQDWTGEGLPPVGTVCEWKHAGQWLKVEVAYLSEWLIVLRDTRKADSSLIDSEGVEIAIDHWKEDAPVFRPIRTPEQIAAEEREKAIKEMLALDPYLPGTQLGMMSRADFCRALHDAGYRKVTP